MSTLFALIIVHGRFVLLVVFECLEKSLGSRGEVRVPGRPGRLRRETKRGVAAVVLREKRAGVVGDEKVDDRKIDGLVPASVVQRDAPKVVTCGDQFGV